MCTNFYAQFDLFSIVSRMMNKEYGVFFRTALQIKNLIFSNKFYKIKLEQDMLDYVELDKFW